MKTTSCESTTSTSRVCRSTSWTLSISWHPSAEQKKKEADIEGCAQIGNRIQGDSSMTTTTLPLAAIPVSPLFSSVSLQSFAAGPAPRNDVQPGELIIDPPTLINLGFEWF